MMTLTDLRERLTVIVLTIEIYLSDVITETKAEAYISAAYADNLLVIVRKADPVSDIDACNGGMYIHVPTFYYGTFYL